MVELSSLAAESFRFYESTRKKRGLQEDKKVEKEAQEFLLLPALLVGLSFSNA